MELKVWKIYKSFSKKIKVISEPSGIERDKIISKPAIFTFVISEPSGIESFHKHITHTQTYHVISEPSGIERICLGPFWEYLFESYIWT